MTKKKAAKAAPKKKRTAKAAQKMAPEEKAPLGYMAGTSTPRTRKKVAIMGFAASSMEDVKFVLEVLRPISLEEGCRRNPYLRKKNAPRGGDMQMVNAAGTPYRFYECPYFDEANKQCTVHGTPLKPPMCRNYPLYGKEIPCSKGLQSPSCGYHVLQPTGEELKNSDAQV